MWSGWRPAFGESGVFACAPLSFSSPSFQYLFICVCLAMMGLHCFAGCSLVVSSRACSLVVEHELLIAGTLLIARTSLVANHRLSSHGTQASLPCGMWDLLRTGDQTCVSYTAGRFFTTEPNWGNPAFVFFPPP